MKQSKLSELLSQLRLETCQSVYEMAKNLDMSTQDLIALERDNKIPPNNFLLKLMLNGYHITDKRECILTKEISRLIRKLSY
jgi:DNA-binding XRE family transcriptional regulator